jgi:hypothetical protein
VADEMEELTREAGVRHFEFVDSTFNAPPRHATGSASRSCAAGCG